MSAPAALPIIDAPVLNRLPSLPYFPTLEELAAHMADCLTCLADESCLEQDALELALRWDIAAQASCAELN
jgi:hypothetical protein